MSASAGPEAMRAGLEQSWVLPASEAADLAIVKSNVTLRVTLLDIDTISKNNSVLLAS